MQILAFMIQKGGTSKTTSCSALAHGLTAKGKTVLLIDLDPQQNLSFAEGVNVLDIPCTLYEVWKDHKPIKDAIQPVNLALDIITGGLSLASADFEFSGAVGREQLLKRSIDQLSADYDYCIVDCPPSLGLLTMNAATAADQVIIPMTVDALAIQGLSQLWGFLANIRTFCNPGLSVAGILLTKYDDRTLTTKGLENLIVQSADQAGTKVFQNRIHKSQAIETAQSLQTTDVYSQNARAAADYRSFTGELLEELEREE